MNRNAFLTLRMRRQRFLPPTDSREEYTELFRQMSPVRTVHCCCPGEPPQLVFRTDFDNAEACYILRSKREIVKGRFQNGGIGYVFADELDLFGAAYQTPANRLTNDEMELLDLLQREGPMNVRLIKEMTGWLSKEITPVLHKLQEKFLVFEDQADSEWDRSWYLFETEFPDVDFDGYSRQLAIQELVSRFAALNLWITGGMVRDFYRFTKKDCDAAISALCDMGVLKKALLDGEKGYIRPEDEKLLSEDIQEGPAGVFVLHRNDCLVKANETMLKQRFQHPDYDVLQYILLDGDFHGAVLGQFKNGPFIVSDVMLDIPENEAIRRKQEILEAISRVNDPQKSPVARYLGRPV